MEEDKEAAATALQLDWARQRRHQQRPQGSAVLVSSLRLIMNLLDLIMNWNLFLFAGSENFG
jgi:hypothetical protein